MGQEEKFKEAKRLYETANTDQRYVLETLFPELAESEDEKMIKSLIRLVIAFYNVNFPTPEGFERKDMLAWLEKQGEQSDANKEYWRGYREGKQEILDKYAELEKQDKQKPAEWSEHQHKLLNYAISMTDDTEVKRFLESLRNAGSNTSAAWSEEDEKVSNNILYILNQLEDNAIYNEDKIAKECIDWIYSIKDRVQPQPKYEWTDNDRKIAFRISSVLEEAASEHAFMSTKRLIGDKEVIEIEEWLKSLRSQSHWRPSKEQMEALEVAVKHCDRSDYRVTHTHTKELLEQLKKL